MENTVNDTLWKESKMLASPNRGSKNQEFTMGNSPRLLE